MGHRYDQKVFGIGMHRTRTMSLHTAFRILGYESVHFPWRLFPELEVELLEKHNAFTDFPIPLYFRELDARYPGSKFILTVRDVESWLKSTEWLFTVGAEVFKWADNPLIDPIHKATYGITHWDRAVFEARWHRHLWEVRTHFADRPDDLLEYDLTQNQGWGPLCAFLDKPIPQVPFPHEHESKKMSEHP